MGNTDSASLYAFAGADPVNGRDPTGRYAESGHYYTVLYVAIALGYSIDDAQRIAFYAQAPDEMGEYDAIENYKDALVERARNADPMVKTTQHTARSEWC